MKPSRVNKDYLTPEKLKEAAQKRKMEYVSPWDNIFPPHIQEWMDKHHPLSGSAQFWPLW